MRKIWLISCLKYTVNCTGRSKKDLIKRMVSHEFNRFSETSLLCEEVETPTDSRGERNSRGGANELGDNYSCTQIWGSPECLSNLGKTG